MTCSGDDTIKLFSYMDKLRDQALATGGMVLSHLGNHEWMNVIGGLRLEFSPPMLSDEHPFSR